MKKTQCQSIFKNGTESTTPAQVTQIWVTLINQIEKASAVISAKSKP